LRFNSGLKTTALVLLGLLILASPSVPRAHARGVVSTLTLFGDPYGVAYDAAKGEVFVAELDSNLVAVISDSTNT
jgi:DNA-binding beta-propeller fold protein YncE